MYSLLLATVLAVVIMWTGIVLARGGLIGTSLLVLLAGSCFGHPFFHVSVGPLPLTADRLLLIVLIAQYVAYRRWGQIEPKPPLKADYVLGAFLLVLVVSTLAHDYRSGGWRPMAYLVSFYAMPAVMYWMARQAEWTARTAWCVFGALAGFGVYLCLTAVAETHGAWNFVFPKYIASPAFSEFFGRGRGPFLNPVANGMVQSIGLCAALLWWPRAGRVGQLLLLSVIVPVFAWGIFSTLTRSVWMGAFLGTLVVVALAMPRLWRAAVIGVATVACVLVLAVGWDNLLTFKRDKGVDAELTAESARLRPILATVAWHMFLDRPLLGCGFGHYPNEMPAYLSDRSTDLPLEKAHPFVQHDVFLALLTETGIVGMGLFVALLASWTLAAWRLWRTTAAPLWKRQVGLLFLAAIGVYLPNGMFHDVSIIAMVNMLLFFLAGATMALVPNDRRRGAARSAELRLWNEPREPALAAR